MQKKVSSRNHDSGRVGVKDPAPGSTIVYDLPARPVSRAKFAGSVVIRLEADEPIRPLTIMKIEIVLTVGLVLEGHTVYNSQQNHRTKY